MKIEIIDNGEFSKGTLSETALLLNPFIRRELMKKLSEKNDTREKKKCDK